MLAVCCLPDRASADNNCNGNACSVVTVHYNGHGYDLHNGGGKPVKLNVRWAFLLSCQGGVDILLAPGETKTFGNGGYCNPYSANFE